MNITLVGYIYLNNPTCLIMKIIMMTSTKVCQGNPRAYEITPKVITFMNPGSFVLCNYETFPKDVNNELGKILLSAASMRHQFLN